MCIYIYIHTYIHTYIYIHICIQTERERESPHARLFPRKACADPASRPLDSQAQGLGVAAQIQF